MHTPHLSEVPWLRDGRGEAQGGEELRDQSLLHASGTNALCADRRGQSRHLAEVVVEPPRPRREFLKPAGPGGVGAGVQAAAVTEVVLRWRSGGGGRADEPAERGVWCGANRGRDGRRDVVDVRP